MDQSSVENAIVCSPGIGADTKPRVKGLLNARPQCISDLGDYGVRNCGELVPCLIGRIYCNTMYIFYHCRFVCVNWTL